MAMLDGKVAIVTGGNSGIGAMTAQVFASEGATVVVAARRVAEGEVIAEQIGPAASFFPTDVTQERDIAALLRHVAERFGRLDCLVNNAGNPGVMNGIAETEAAHWDSVFYQPAEWLTHRHGSHRHGGRRPAIHDFSVGNEEKSWMPT
jgi:NAD(P)-dependent dehydrogenase (short-subunit alcohol dehydrogenase family)